MLLNRLYLRNFRVYEDELDLELPPGLVGVYGANGAGKSTLLEAILFALWGRARTPKDAIRSAGVGGETIAEVTFEHEGHLYGVRRTLSGINATVKAEAHADGMLMAAGVREVGRYVHSVLGMDDVAFRASVFAEQKQLAAFSSQAPADRRKLVLQLLGITPLDGARDAARADAKATADRHRQLRDLLPDLDTLTVAADDADAAAGAAETAADTEEGALEVLRQREEEAAAALATADAGRQTYEQLVRDGRAARAELDRAVGQVDQLSVEEGQLTDAAARLAEVAARAAGVDASEALVPALTGVLDATRQRDAVSVGAEPPVPDPAAREAAETAARDARDDLAGLQGRMEAAQADLRRATDAATRSADLSGEGACPLCGQALGDAFAAVQDHRRAEVVEAETRLAELRAAKAPLQERAAAAVTDLDRVSEADRLARTARDAWQRATERRDEADSAVAAARKMALDLVDQLPESVTDLEDLRDRTATGLRAARAAAGEAAQLRGRLERRRAVTDGLAVARRQVEEATTVVDELRRQVRALDFDPARLDAARRTAEQAGERRRAADEAARRTRQEAIRARTRADGAAQRLADARAQHAQLADLERDSRHLRRLADLLGDFRNTVVASVGPRLALQAAELFGELTDHEYDELQVDPETYELQISDAGRSYGLDRFSGSEVDLANLALRVAISEHVRFQSGGSVGLLVLDEVFGPLDDERKLRMLGALQRLGGRFRQVLVVTHDNEIKEQLPNAIEVVKRPGRRASAHLTGA